MDPTPAAAASAATSAATSAPASRLREIFPTNDALAGLFTVDAAIVAVRVGITLVLGLVLVGLVVSILRRIALKRTDPRTGGLVIKIAQYLGFALIAISTLEAADVNLSALLGAAGIAGIALGFAAQTSVSNFISGFFIVSEKMFTQGDVISVDGKTGIVYSIDAMSIKLRTFDNQLIRIPNETLIKTNVSNITRFPVRRLNMDMLVTYDTDVERAKAILLDVAAANPNALRNPEPVFMVSGFKDSGIGLFFGVWFATGEWFDGNNDMYVAVKKRFDAEGVRFAYPTMTVLADAPSKPAPKRGKIRS